MSHWNSPDVSLWQIQARQQQTQIFATYGDRIWWSGIPNFNDLYLQQSIAYILYGPPPIHGIANIAHAGYTLEEVEDIFNFTKIVCKNFTGYTYISVVFILTKYQNKTETEGILRIWNEIEHKFLDTSGRVYKNWSTFLKKNKLPPRYICYPSEGRYKMGIALELCLEFSTTPSFKVPKTYRPSSSCCSCGVPCRMIFIILLILLAIASIYFAISAAMDILYAPAALFVVGGGYSYFSCRRHMGVRLCCCCMQCCCD